MGMGLHTVMPMNVYGIFPKSRCNKTASEEDQDVLVRLVPRRQMTFEI